MLGTPGERVHEIAERVLAPLAGGASPDGYFFHLSVEHEGPVRAYLEQQLAAPGKRPRPHGADARLSWRDPECDYRARLDTDTATV
jgi:hypothetical protein